MKNHFKTYQLLITVIDIFPNFLHLFLMHTLLSVFKKKTKTIL